MPPRLRLAAVAVPVLVAATVGGAQAGSPRPDTKKPTAPTSLTVSNVAPSGMTLSWQPSKDNVGVAGYDIYVDGKLTSTMP
jgi:hypothetical protein